MFENLISMTSEQLDTTADALAAGECAAVLADSHGVYILLSPGPDYAASFACGRQRSGKWVPVGLSPLQYSVIGEWSRLNVPAVCKRWRERHG